MIDDQIRAVQYAITDAESDLEKFHRLELNFLSNDSEYARHLLTRLADLREATKTLQSVKQLRAGLIEEAEERA